MNKCIILYFQIECNCDGQQYVTLLNSHQSKSMDFYPFQLLYTYILDFLNISIIISKNAKL